MKTWISRALAVPISLAACFGFVSSAGAATADVTFNPTAVTANLLGDRSFEITYRTKDPAPACSKGGEFYTDPDKAIGVKLGEILHPVKMTVKNRTALELVTIPAGVIDEIKRRRITRPIYYSRYWINCESTKYLTWTDIPLTVIFFSVEAVPASVRVATGNDTLVPVRWRATFGNGVSSRVESQEGRFVDGAGRVYGSAVRDPLQASGMSPLEFDESLRVPASVVNSVLAGGGAGFRYERTFTMEGFHAIGAVRLQFAGRIASAFSIDRAELQFLDGSRFKTVPLGEEVQVEADITFSGSGRLQGSWDLADPATTAGAPIFVRKALVDEYLSFGRRALIRSPAIKADFLGTYIVRLSITSPNLGEDGVLQLTFVVRATGEAVEISLGVPPPLARLSPGLPFTWKAVAGVRNYLLEFYEVPNPESQEPVAGMVLPGGESRAALSQATERNFQPGRTYWWRVVALGPDGVLLGKSALREVLTPQE